MDGEICRVRTAEFVTTDSGTGIVHVAPAYGEDDLKLGLAHGLPVLHCVGDDGCFLPQVSPVAGLFFKAGDPIIIDLLKELQRELHLSYVFISHDLSTVQAICDEVIVMHRGEAVERLPADQLPHGAQHPYSRTLFASVPKLDPAWLDSLPA